MRHVWFGTLSRFLKDTLLLGLLGYGGLHLGAEALVQLINAGPHGLDDAVGLLGLGNVLLHLLELLLLGLQQAQHLLQCAADLKGKMGWKEG